MPKKRVSVVPTEVTFVERPTRGKRYDAVVRMMATGQVPAPTEDPIIKALRWRGMTDEEASRVVLPLHPKATMPRRPFDQGTQDVAARYLTAVGERRKGAGWSCGCQVHRDTRPIWVYHPTASVTGWSGLDVTPCERHRGAFEGRDGLIREKVS